MVQSVSVKSAVHIALSDAAFHALIQGRIDVDGYNPAIIALKNIPILVLDRASTYKGEF